MTIVMSRENKFPYEIKAVDPYSGREMSTAWTNNDDWQNRIKYAMWETRRDTGAAIETIMYHTTLEETKAQLRKVGFLVDEQMTESYDVRSDVAKTNIWQRNNDGFFLVARKI